MFALTLVLFCILGGAIGQIAMKSGMNQVGEIGNMKQLFDLNTLFRIFTNPRVIIGLVSYGLSAVLWLGALSTLNVSLMYPLLGLGYVVTAVAAVVYLKESVVWLQWLGIFLVVAGVVLITRAGKF